MIDDGDNHAFDDGDACDSDDALSTAARNADVVTRPNLLPFPSQADNPGGLLRVQ